MNNKKVIIALALLFGMCFGFSLTLAYNTDESVLENKFKLGEWKTVYTEEFESPSNWVTCQTVDKTIIVKNESNIDASVRIKLEEKWKKKDGIELPLVSETSGYQMAQINFLEESGWTKDDNDGYYYYDVDLKKNESTKSLTTGVTLNCDANLDVDVDYAGATYHLKYTVQMIQADKKDEWRTSQRTRLYSVIAGLSSNIDTTEKIDNAVNEYSASSNSDFPIYYYRGENVNNNLIFADKCWRIVRTAENGATKIIYNGTPDGGKCVATGDGATIATNISFNAAVPKDSSSYYQTYYTEYLSYMLPEFSDDHNYITPLDKSCQSISNSTYCSLGVYFGKDVVWNESTQRYTLTNTYKTVKALSDSDNSEDNLKISEGYRYTCLARNTLSCETVYYVASLGDKNWYHLITLKRGKKLEDWHNEIFANTNDNNVKTIVDQWYEQNISENNSDKIADVVYCNDRQIVSGALTSSDRSSRQDNFYGRLQYWYNQFAYYKNRQYGGATLDCALERDSLTASSANGNGALKYPVAIISADEAQLANGALNNAATASYTMTPSVIRTGSESSALPYSILCLSSSGINSGCKAVRPATALKYDTYVVSGDGSTDSPYKLEW